MKLVLRISAILLAAAAFALPAEGVASWLVGGEPTEANVQGVQVLRMVVGLHALVLLAAGVLRLEGEREPLMAAGVRTPEPAAAGTWIALAVIVAVGLGLRLVRLGEGLWFDEIDTLVHYVRRPLGAIVSTFDSKNQHLLYSIAARPFVASAGSVGDEAFALRLPAALFGAASLVAVWLFGRRVAPEREALLAAALLAVSYHHVWFSQNARGYTGLLFFTLLGSTAFLRLISRRGGGLCLPAQYGMWMALAAYTHATAVLVVAAHGLIWLGLLAFSRGPGADSSSPGMGRNRWMPLVGFGFAASLACLLYSLVLPQFLDTLLAPTMPGKETDWKNPLWLVTETLGRLADGLPGGWFALAGAALVGGWGLWSYARQGRVVLAVMLLPALVTAAAIVAMKHNLWPRFFFFSAGFFVLLALRGVSGWTGLVASRLGPRRERALQLAAGLVLIAGGAWTVQRAWGPKQDYAGAVAFVEAERAPGEVLVTADMTTFPVQDYLAAKSEAVDNLPALLALEARSPGTWFLLTFPTRFQAELPELWEHLESSYEEAQTFWGTVGGGAVVVYQRRPR